MDLSSLAGTFTGMKQAEYAQQASVEVAKKSLDLAEKQGEAVLKLMESAEMPKNTGGRTGNILDVKG
ncbi:YjfB family protein [Limisalsivibrio acetivorans]|uniref:YjfB family protein n=1 Tax=Limisalsivibrio acetivorans TaxID=1304888 RepID=UPI0003B462D9|nr:YjfB family protein [Limisalsivibrio acetivorans]